MIEIDVIIDRLVFPRLGVDSDFKIYGVKVANENDIALHNLKINQYGNLTFNGVMPMLEVGSKYKAKVTEKKHPKYGIGYEVESIFQDIPTSLEGQQAYLSTILTEYQVKNIYEAYEGEDIIQLIKDDAFNYKLVKGMGESTFQAVKEKIMANLELQEALVALSKFGLTYKIVSKLVKKYGSARLVVEKIEENPYVLTEVDGIGFVKCDQYALNMGIEKDSTYRINACIEYVLDEEANSNGHSWIDKDALIKNAVELLNISDTKVSDNINESNKELHVEGNKVSKVLNYLYEKWTYDSVKRLLSHKPTEIKDLDQRIKTAEEAQGFEFTDEQRDAIKLASENNIVVITGKAGTGKTTILKGIISVLKGTEDFKEYSACALSGKAAQRIQESTGLSASTIHRLLGWDRETGTFCHNLNNPLPKGVNVLDEASMANSYLFCSLLNAIPVGSKFIVLGDTEQLEPIGSGNIFKDMVESGTLPVAYLTQVHRQAMKSGILSTANEIREGIQFNKKDNLENRVIGELKDLYFKPYKKSSTVKEAILKVCKQYAKSPECDISNFQVIVPLKNKGEIATKKLNVELQEIFNPELKPVLNRNGYNFKEGDKVIQQGNNYDVEVFNGTIGIIKNVDTEKKEVHIKFSGVLDTVIYSQEDMSQIDLAYALSVHRVQGSQFDNVVIGLDYSAYIMLSRQLVYTALTRASKLAFLICENEALLHAVRTDKASKRNTYLKELLQSVDK